MTFSSASNFGRATQSIRPKSRGEEINLDGLRVGATRRLWLRRSPMLFAAAFASELAAELGAEDADCEAPEQSHDGGGRIGMFDRTIGVIDAHGRIERSDHRRPRGHHLLVGALA